MSVTEYLIGPLGAALLHVLAGVCVVLYGFGVIGQPTGKAAEKNPPKTRPLFVVGGLAIIAFGLAFAVRALMR